MFQEDSIEMCILSRVKQITSPAGCMRQVLGAGALDASYDSRNYSWKSIVRVS